VDDTTRDVRGLPPRRSHEPKPTPTASSAPTPTTPSTARNRPGIIEFEGKGLGELTKALADKEGQIAAIGGRLMTRGSKGGETDDQATMRQANEFSLLLNVIQACEVGMALCLRYWLAFADEPLSATEELSFRINTDFLSPSFSAREMRAIQLMYEGGILPVDALYNCLLKADLMTDATSLEDFVTMLNNDSFFPGQPDVQAMRRGYTSRQQELDQARIAREEDFQQQELDLQARQVKLEEKAAQRAAQTKVPMAGQPILVPVTPAVVKPGVGAGQPPAGATQTVTMHSWSPAPMTSSLLGWSGRRRSQTTLMG
jgi:hypothetical protein